VLAAICSDRYLGNAAGKRGELPGEMDIDAVA
jgi:hypothetical protein